MNCYVLCLVALVAWISETAAFNTEPGRLGCYEDNNGAVWKQWNNWHEKNTVRFCKNMCNDFKFAGVEAGKWCSCGDVIPPTSVPDSRCNAPCTGDPAQTCGGPGWVLEIFPVEQKPDVRGKYTGCFQDATEPVWKTGWIFLTTNSPQRCFNSCRGFRFAGMEAGSWCLCGDTLPLTSLPLTSCQTECPGHVGKKCGGTKTLDVYELSEDLRVLGCIPAEYQAHGDLGTYKLYTQPKSWDEAWQQCEDDDAHLLIINSEDEAEFVRSLFAQVPSETRMHAGFHDLLRKGTYRTLFGEPLSATGYTEWSAQHPQKPSSVQHCGCVNAQAQLAQIDGNCAAQAMFVCEKKADSPDGRGQGGQIDVRGFGLGALGI